MATHTMPDSLLTSDRRPPTAPIDGPLVLHARVVTGAGGGPDKTIINSPRFLRQHGYRCECLFLRPPGDEKFEAIRRRADNAEADIVELDDTGPWSTTIVRRVAEICRQRGVTIWHAHDYKTNLLGLLVKRRYPMRLITTCHGWVERTWRTLIYHQVDRLTLRRYDRVVAVSADIEAKCRQLGVPEARLSLIENAIDADHYLRRRSPIEAKQALGWPTHELVIGAVGRLSGEKGFDRLIGAFASAFAADPNVVLAIAGDGAEMESLAQLARTLGVADRVRLLGFQSDLMTLYEAMDLFVLSSIREGLPNVVLEAMAMQTPVISTRIAGVPRVIQDGENGFLVTPGSVDELAAVMSRATHDENLRHRIAAAGRASVETRYSFKVRMAKMAAIYDQLMARQPPAG